MLGGGASSRMGRDKASLDLDGTAMASRVASALQDCLSTVRIVLRPGQENPTDLTRIDDHHEARAPIVGVAAALEAAEAPAVLVAACDLPGLHARFLLALLAHVPAFGGAEIVAPRTSRGPEPLVAVYRRTLLPELGRRIEAGQLALQGLLRDCDTQLVDAAQLRGIDPELAALRNVNRPEDLP